MGIIYKPNIPKHLPTDSLYYTATFQKLWHAIDFIYFRSFYTLIARKVTAMIPLMEEETTVTRFSFYKFVHFLFWNRPF